MNTPPKLLAPCDLARLWSVTTEQILDLCRSGGLPHIRLNKRVIRIPAVDAAAYYAVRETRAKSG